MKRLTSAIARLFSWVRPLEEILFGLGDRDAYRPAGCNNILGLLLHLCDSDHQLSTAVLRWIAYQLRNPGAKMATALVFNGRNRGIDIFCDQVLGGLFNHRMIEATQLHDVLTRWAVPQSDLIIVHGVFSGQHIARMKAFITAEAFVVERHRARPETRNNHLNFVFASHWPDLLPESAGSRRFTIIEAPVEWPRRYYEAVLHELKTGGVAAFRDYLLHDLDLGDFDANTLSLHPNIYRTKEAA